MNLNTAFSFIAPKKTRQIKHYWKEFFSIKMQDIFSLSSPFAMLHICREKTKSQEVILSIAAICHYFLRFLERPYQLSYFFKIASSSIFCYFTAQIFFLPLWHCSLKIFCIITLLSVDPPCLKLMARHRFSYYRADQVSADLVPTTSSILSSPSISLKSLLDVLPPLPPAKTF